MFSADSLDQLRRALKDPLKKKIIAKVGCHLSTGVFFTISFSLG